MKNVPKFLFLEKFPEIWYFRINFRENSVFKEKGKIIQL